jgi:hypothetical protein
MKTTLFALAVLVAGSSIATAESKTPSKAPELLFTANTRTMPQYQRNATYGNTIWGTTGLILVPSAFVQPQKTLGAGISFSDDLTAGYVNFGLMENLEVGGTILDNRNNNKSDGLINAKFHFVPANNDRFHLGVGIIDAADVRQQSFYIVASSAITVPDFAKDNNAVGLNLHFGAGSGIFEHGVFAGAEVFFPRGLSLLTEWDTEDLNFGLRYNFNPSFTGEIGSYSTNPYFKLAYTTQF